MNDSTSLFTRVAAPAVLLFSVLNVLGCGLGEPSGTSDETSEERPTNSIRRNARLPSWDALGVQPREMRDDDWFEDVTAQAGVRFAYRDGRDRFRFLRAVYWLYEKFIY